MMQIDQNMLKRILEMDDRTLGLMIGRIASESGIDPASIHPDAETLGKLRQALGSAKDADLEQLAALYNNHHQNRHS